MSDAELAAVLGGPVERRPWERSSSAPLELVRTAGRGPFVLKPTSGGSRPAHAVDPCRERDAYALLPRELGAPELIAAGDGWILLELVEGVPLAEASDLAAWEAAARCLARLHATPPRGLPAHDAEAVIERALAAEPALASVEPAARDAAARLAAAPPVLVHGEAYAANLLVGTDGRIRPLDWETAGTGAAALDLAALTSGTWAPDERDRVLAAYGPVDPAELDAARLIVALQWVGWAPAWTPPPEHRHDWLAEALAR